MKTILTLCLALATLAGSAQVVPIVRNKFTTNNSTASVVINADILDATINSNKLDTATKNLLMGGTNQAYVAADLVVSNAVVSRVNGRGTNATFYLDSGGWFLAEQTTGLHLLGYNNAAWFGDTDAIISEVPYTNTVGIGGNGQYLTALNGQNITSGTISNTQIAAATIGHDKLTIPPLTNNETRVVRFTSLVSAPTNYTDRVEATNSSTLTLYGGGLEAALESGAFKVRSPYYFQGIATGLTQIPGSGITAGSISNAAIADATITSNKLAFAVATPTQVSDVTNATSIRAITAQQTNQAAILALTAQQTNYAALIAMLGPLTNGLGGGAIGGTYQWTNDVNADGNNLYELATIYGSSNSLALTLTGSSAAQDNAISIYRTNSGNGISYFSQIGHEFSGPVSFVDGVGNISAGTLAATGNVTATGTSNYVAALHTDVFSPDELDVDNLYVTNLFTLITNATGLATDSNGQLIAGSGSTYSNLTESGYVTTVLSNFVVNAGSANTLVVTNGVVGINKVPSTSYALDATGSMRVSGSITVGANEQFNSLGALYIGSASGSDMYFRDGSGVNMFIKSDGNVGIGNSAPAAKLDVTGDIRASTTITATNGFIPQIKAGFSTNYTLAVSDAVVFATGTNQVLTLPSAPTAGKIYTINVASTTGSAMVTNATGAQTIKGVLSITVGATNMVNVIFDGSNWW